MSSTAATASQIDYLRTLVAKYRERNAISRNSELSVRRFGFNVGMDELRAAEAARATEVADAKAAGTLREWRIALRLELLDAKIAADDAFADSLAAVDLSALDKAAASTLIDRLR